MTVILFIYKIVGFLKDINKSYKIKIRKLINFIFFIFNNFINDTIHCFINIKIIF